MYKEWIKELRVIDWQKEFNVHFDNRMKNSMNNNQCAFILSLFLKQTLTILATIKVS